MGVSKRVYTAAAVVVVGAALTGAAKSASATPSVAPLTWAQATRSARPRFTPKRTIEVHSLDQFWSAWNAIAPGDLLDVHGVTFTGETILTNKHLSGWAEVHFDASTRFVGPSGGDLPAVWIKSDSDVRLYGGSVTNPRGGAGVIVYDSAWFTWRGFAIHDTAGSGLMVQGITTANDHLDLEGDISRWGLDLALDPHAEKGTGLHGALLADAYYGVENSRFVLTLDDGATGAGVEAGGARPTDVFRNNILYLRCHDLTKEATTQVAGNCLEFWGQNVTGNVVKYLSASDIKGRPFDANGMDAGQSLRSDVVVYGRASDTNLNPNLGRTESSIPAGERWDRRFGTVFRNVR